MVSKSVLFALTVVALVTGGSSFVTGVSENFNPCVGALLTVNKHFNLGLNVGGFIKGAFGIVVDVITNIEKLLFGASGSIFGGGKDSTCPPPKNLNQALGFVQFGMYINDRALRKNLGSLYEKDYLSQIYIHACRTALLKANVDISAYTWLKLDADFDYHLYTRELRALKAQVSGRGLAALFVNIDFFLTTIEANIGNLFSNLGDILSICWNIIIGYSRGCGYSEYQSGYTTVKATYNSVLISNGCGSINEKYLTSGSYCDACINY